jgi:hypothetical protein
MSTSVDDEGYSMKPIVEDPFQARSSVDSDNGLEKIEYRSI